MKKGGGGGLLWLTRHPTKGVCPERPLGVKDLSWTPTKDSCPACPDLVAEEHRETTEGSDLVGKDLTSHPISALKTHFTLPPPIQEQSHGPLAPAVVPAVSAPTLP